MNSRSQIRCYKPAFVLQRYFCTFAANPSDSISDVVIQMHFLSLYKGRICVYSTRTDFKRNSYTNSYTKFLFGSRQIFKNPEFFSQNRKSYTNSYTYSDTKIRSKHEKIYIASYPRHYGHLEDPLCRIWKTRGRELHCSPNTTSQCHYTQKTHASPTAGDRWETSHSTTATANATGGQSRRLSFQARRHNTPTQPFIAGPSKPGENWNTTCSWNGRP